MGKKSACIMIMKYKNHLLEGKKKKEKKKRERKSNLEFVTEVPRALLVSCAQLDHQES